MNKETKQFVFGLIMFGYGHYRFEYSIVLVNELTYKALPLNEKFAMLIWVLLMIKGLLMIDKTIK